MDSNTLIVAICMASVTLSGTANNFAGRIRAEVLGDYTSMAVVADSLFYFLFNAAVCCVLIWKGQVTKGQLEFLLRRGPTWQQCGPWKYLVLAAVNDVANNVTGLASQPHLTPLMMSLADQATTPFTAICSVSLLGTRYTALEVVAVTAVAAAAVMSVLVGTSGGEGDNSTFWAAFAAVTTSFAALSYVLKEKTFDAYKIFREKSLACGSSSVQMARTNSQMSSPLNGGDSSTNGQLATGGREQEQLGDLPPSLNVFLVATMIGAVSLLVCVPMALLNQKLTSSEPPWPAFKKGMHCLIYCEHAIPAYIVYITINICFNTFLLICTERGSALLAFLSLKLVVPVTAVMSPLPWPLIGSKSVSNAQWLVLLVMLIGIVAFRLGNIQRHRRGLQKCCWPLTGP